MKRSPEGESEEFHVLFEYSCKTTACIVCDETGTDSPVGAQVCKSAYKSKLLVKKCYVTPDVYLRF